MNVLRRIALGILSSLFVSLLFATAFDIGFARTATNPTTVKKLVADSGLYGSAVSSLLQQTKSINTQVGTISASDPIIQKAANQTITPQFIQQNSETTIDSIYAWLNGKTPQPDFNINLSGVKDNFASSVADAAQQRLQTLPACTYAQSSAIASGGQYDAINATCLPQGVTAASAATQLKTSIAGNGDFLDKTTLNASNLKGNNGQSVFSDQLKNLPKQYQQAKKTPLILSILAILCGTGIVFLSTSRLKGLRHIGINLAVIGVLMLVFSYALNKVATTQLVPKIKLDNTVLQQDVRSLVTELVQQIDKNYWFFGGLYAVLGAGSITAAEVLRRQARPAVAVKNTDTPDEGVSVTPKSNTKPKT